MSEPSPPREDPLVFSSRRLHRQPGSSETEQRSVTMDAGWGNSVSHASPGREVPVEFLLESAHDGILIAGRADVPIEAECVRCLKALSWTEPITVQQFFAYPEAAEPGDEDSDEDVAVMVGDLLDLRGAFRDAVVLALPLSPVCRDDCPGLCSECGFELAQDADHRHDRTDPRWAALADRVPRPSASEGE